MDTTLQQLLLQAQQAAPGSEARQMAIARIAAQILKSRQVGRSCKGQPLADIHLELVQAAEQQLQQCVEQTIATCNFQRTSPATYTQSLRDQVFQAVLTQERLQQLALAVQQCQPRTEAWQYTIQELVNGLRCSGKLARLPGVTRDVYADVVNQTLLWVCQNIQNYDAERGAFVSWVNYRMGMIARQVQQEQRDPYTQAMQGRILRLKYELSAVVKRINAKGLQTWLRLHLKRLVPDLSVSHWVMQTLIVMGILATLLQQTPEIGNTLLFTIVQESILAPPIVTSVAETQQLEAIAQPELEPSLLEGIRHYLETDPKQLCQKHIRNHPQATFQRIALSRMDNVSWQTLSNTLGIGIPALSGFYQRTLKDLAPEIRQFVQEQF